MLSKDKTKKDYIESDSQDSARIDSGFLSSSNISSEICSYDDEVTSGARNSQHLSRLDLDPEEMVKSQPLSPLDSGVDLSCQISELNLQSDSCEVQEDTSQTCVRPWPQPLSSNYFDQDEDGNTQLHIAVMKGYTDVVYSLVQSIRESRYLDIRNDLCQTALHLSILANQPQLTRHLVLSGAKTNLRDEFGNTALHLAVETQNMSCLEALTNVISNYEISALNLQYTAPRKITLNIETVNYNGLYCVHLAALSGNIDILKRLLWLGANIDSKEYKAGYTPLHVAVLKRNVEMTKFILSQTNCDIEEETYGGYTAYQLSFDEDVRALLLSHNADKVPLSDSDEEDDDEDEDNVST